MAPTRDGRRVQDLDGAVTAPLLVHGEQRALGSPGGEDGPGVVVAGQLADVSRAARERD